jgi:uncharacterized membrane protein
MVKKIFAIVFLIIGIYYMYKLANLAKKNEHKVDNFLGDNKNKLSYPEETSSFFKYLLIFIICMFIFSQLI